MRRPKLKLTAEGCRALRMIAASPTGCSESLMFARGFQRALVAGLIEHKLATAGSRPMKAGAQRIEVTQIRITDAGRLALQQ